MNNQISDLNIDWEQRSNQKILIHENFRDNYLTELDYQECCDEFLNGIYSVTDGFQKYKANPVKLGCWASKIKRCLKFYFITIFLR